MPAHGFSSGKAKHLTPDLRGQPNPISARIQSGANPTERINYPRSLWRILAFTMLLCLPRGRSDGQDPVGSNCQDFVSFDQASEVSGSRLAEA